MFRLKTSGSFRNTERFLQNAAKINFRSIVESAAQEGVRALANATPIDSGLAAESWDVLIEGGRSGIRITWINTDVESGFPVAIMLQYGYGTGTGGYVQGRDYINPAIRPIFDKIADRVWKAVTSA
jgi:hypothetical protein